MVEKKTPIAIDNFKGLFDQGCADDVPFDHFISCLNIVPRSSGFETREGSSLAHTKTGVLRFHIYKRIGEAQRLIVLVGNSLYDSLDLATPILTVTGMTDFSLVTLFNRAYVTPHNGNKGIAGEFVYVYTGSGVCRKAAGVAPAGFTLLATTPATAGYIEAGTHIFAVAYETASGFITAPGPAVYTVYTAPGGFKVTIGNIPVGPTGTIARYLIGTKVIQDYNGDQVNQEYFFIPGGYIEDNTTTTLDVSFFDADLQSSADYLFDQLAEIPASLGLGTYLGSLVTYGEDLYDSIIRVSESGQPESFAATDGYATVDPGDGFGVKNVVEYRGSLIIFKSKRTYTTVATGQRAAYWTIVPIDKSIGTEVFGVCQVLDAAGASTDTLMIADRSGLLMYDGTYRMDLSDKIRNIWTQINQSKFNLIQVCLDPTSKRIYVNFPYQTSATCNYVLVADFKNGLDKDNIRWFKWEFPQAPKCIGIDIDNTTKVPIFKYGGTNIYKLDTTVKNDYETAISSYAQLALWHYKGGTTPFADYFNNFSDIRVRAVGAGNLLVTLYGLDNSSPTTLVTKALSENTGKPLLWHCNFNAERISVKFSINAVDKYFNIDRVAVFGNKLWNERPQ